MAAYQTVPPQTVKAMLRDGNELALVDVREQGVYFKAHLLFACCIPISHLELRASDLIPRRGTRVVLCDGKDEGLARTAAERLIDFGYSDVAVMSGGVAAWRDAGFEVFSGVNVVSKAFGEYVEHRYDTPRITAQQLVAKQEARENMIILDSRPMQEFHNVSIPGGIDCPGAELVYRVFDAAPDPETLVVVNCAGRTRSIIGAQSLINAGIPNRVVALKDGTMGWQLAGYKPASGETQHAAAPGAAGLDKAKAAAARVAEKFGVSEIDHERLQRWQLESEQRTLYVLDVRTAEEYAQGHLPGSRHAPGGQLVQATDEYVATRHARIVLVDNDGVRARMTASWLRQMGWDDAYVMQDALNHDLQSGDATPNLLGYRQAETLSASELNDKLQQADIAVLDFASSLEYRKQHIPGALWGVRSRLDEALAHVSAGQTLVITSPDGTLAHYVANDLAQTHPAQPVKVLDGGTRTWVDAGLPVSSSAQHLTTEANDVWYKPYEQASAVREAMQGYLDWEVNLVNQIERDGDAQFR
ncbi:MAG: thiosulfate sulfurtransferase [Betaproteobacteria bacterium]|nr:MAG: thiosulfate sulfurtransferase [Betaproteobacteria bacterium]